MIVDSNDTTASAPTQNAAFLSHEFTIGSSQAFDVGDTVVFATNSGARLDGFSITAIPEPQSFALIGGLLALGAVMVRRRLRG